MATKKSEANSGLAIYERGGALGLRPTAPASLNIVSTFMGNRPIVASGLQVASTYLNGRPIQARSHNVASTFMNNRPHHVRCGQSCGYVHG